MKTNEYKKVAKLCDELLTYLLTKLYTHVNLDLQMEYHRATITLTVADLSQKDMQHIFEALSCKRNPSMEEYGWELLGGSESSNELELVGMCFNEFDYQNKDNLTIITLVRYL